MASIWQAAASLGPAEMAAGGVVAAAAAYRVWGGVSALTDERHEVLQTPLHRELVAGGRGEPANGVFGRSFFANADGLWIYTRRWEAPRPRGVVFLLHGLGEHCGRYEHVAARFNEAGLSVYAMDHQGHGQSSGDRCHVRRFDHLVDDAEQYVARVMAEPSFDHSLPRFLMGHSLGGCIAVLLALRALEKGQDDLWSGGVLLSAPAVSVDPAQATPTLVRLAGVLSWLVPKLPVGNKIAPGMVSRDPRSAYRYATDPLVFHGAIGARFGAEILGAVDRAVAGAASFTWPVLLVQGGADRLVMPEGARSFMAQVSSEDKTLTEYPELAHEVLNEPEWERVMADLLAWVAKRMCA